MEGGGKACSRIGKSINELCMRNICDDKKEQGEMSKLFRESAI